MRLEARRLEISAPESRLRGAGADGPREHGATLARRHARTRVLERRLMARLSRPRPIAPAAIARYLREQRTSTAHPERRDFSIAMAKTRAGAEQIKQSIQKGRSWRVVEAYSIDTFAHQPTTGWVAMLSGELERPLDAAIYHSPIGELGGPVHGRNGWFVFQVRAINGDRNANPRRIRAAARRALRSRQQARARRSLIEVLAKRYRKVTTCSSRYDVWECGG
jgi:hypothetical protein